MPAPVYPLLMPVLLAVVVFISGAVVMILELAASRIIAPYLGTSVVVWTSLIGVILAALSLGYWLGGKIADRYPSLQTLAAILAAASVGIALASYFQWILRGIAETSDLQSAAVVSILLLFGPATTLLGMVSPLAVKLSLTDVARSGRTVGNLYAISNTGSIVGTFLGGFVLISFFGSSKILAVLSLTMLTLAVLVGIAAQTRRPALLSMLIVPLALGGLLAPSGIVLSRGVVLSADPLIIADVDTAYSRTWIYETNDGRRIRTMSNALGGSQSAQYIDEPDELVFEYTKMYDVFEAYVPEPRAALMIGGSAYTYPRHFLRENPESTITVVEIDPGTTALARQYFGLTDDPRLSIVHADGRTFLDRNDERYDVLFIDVFSSHLTIPFQLATKEAVEAMARNLNENGVVIVNIIAGLEGPESEFLAAEYATFSSVFSSVGLLRVKPEKQPGERQNIMLVASKRHLAPESSFLKMLGERAWNEPLMELPVLTDDFAPVERYTTKVRL